MTARPAAPEPTLCVICGYDVAEHRGAGEMVHDFRAPELTEAELRFLDRPDAPESLRERLARAIAASDDVDWDHYLTAEIDLHDNYRKNADAALAVVRGET